MHFHRRDAIIPSHENSTTVTITTNTAAIIQKALFVWASFIDFLRKLLQNHPAKSNKNQSQSRCPLNTKKKHRFRNSASQWIYKRLFQDLPRTGE